MASAPALSPDVAGAGRRADNERLALIDCARALAALALVLFHANAATYQVGGRDFGWMWSLQHGVDFFFVLSGFVIMHAHAAEIGRPAAVSSFMAKRAIRLFPTLWLVVIGYGLARWWFGEGVNHPLAIRSLFPFPTLEPAAPQIIWILRHEILFYLAFAVLLLSARLGVVLLGLWALAIVGQLALSLVGRPLTGIASFYLAAYALDFFLGMALALLHRGRGFRPSIWPFVTGVALLIGYISYRDQLGLGTGIWSDYVAPGGTLGTLIIGLIFVLIVHGQRTGRDVLRYHRASPYDAIIADSYAR